MFSGESVLFINSKVSPGSASDFTPTHEATDSYIFTLLSCCSSYVLSYASISEAVTITSLSVAPLTQMVTFPILGAVGIAGGVAWYLAYGRSRMERTDAVQVLANR